MVAFRVCDSGTALAVTVAQMKITEVLSIENWV